MKTSETTIYIKYRNFVKGHKLLNINSQCDFKWYRGEIIKVKRGIIIEESNTK